MIQHPARSTRTDTLLSYPTRFLFCRRRRGDEGSMEGESGDPGQDQGAGIKGRKRAPGLVHGADRRLSRKARPQADRLGRDPRRPRSEEHKSELQSLMRISYACFCLKKKIYANTVIETQEHTN